MAHTFSGQEVSLWIISCHLLSFNNFLFINKNFLFINNNFLFIKIKLKDTGSS